MNVKTRECPDKHTYDVLVFGDGTVLPQSNVDPNDESVDCPTCGAVEFVEYFGVGKGIHLTGSGPVPYPYWDETLGVTVESYQHMLKVAKSKGLEPLGGRRPNRRSAEQIAWEKSADEGGRYLAEQTEEPWYREMQDKIGEKVTTRTGETQTVIRKEKFNEFARERRLGRGT